MTNLLGNTIIGKIAIFTDSSCLETNLNNCLVILETILDYLSDNLESQQNLILLSDKYISSNNVNFD